MPQIPPREGIRLRRQQIMGQRIRQVREARGFTLQEVSEQFNRSRQWLSGIEWGRNGLDAIDMQDMADFLERPIAYFTDWHWDARKPNWPRALGEWTLLAGGDQDRALAHFELDQSFARD